MPFYRDRMNDEHFWTQYVASRVVAARERVARSPGSFYQADGVARPAAPPQALI